MRRLDRPEDQELSSPPSVVEQVYVRLLSEIISGIRPAGTSIREKKVADQQGVSQASVRQALLRLENEEVVVRIPHRKTMVANPTLEEFQNRIAVRKPLDTLACQLAATRLDQEDYRELEARLADIASPTGSTQADEAFHHYIWDRAGNSLLIRMVKQVSAPMFVFLNEFRRGGLQNRQERIQSHAGLIAALRSRSPSEIARSVEGHIDTAYAAFITSGARDLKSLTKMPLRLLGAAQIITSQSVQASFLESFPGVAIIRDAESRLKYANHEFEQFIGIAGQKIRGQLPRAYFRPDIAEGILMHEHIVREHRTALLTVERLNGYRMTLRFPFAMGGDLMTGALGLDFTSALELLGNEQIGERPVLWSALTARSTAAPPWDVPANLLAGFLNALPAIAALKDLRGRMLWVNPEYERVTGKRPDEVIGVVPTENWQARGEGIAAHDEAVRNTRNSYLTCDPILVANDEVRRINIRFPLISPSGELEMTGLVGFDFDLVNRGRAMLRALAEGGQAWQPLASVQRTQPAPSGLARGPRSSARATHVNGVLQSDTADSTLPAQEEPVEAASKPNNWAKGPGYDGQDE
jgi:DNA-binding GntR family transcriptional regulator